MRQLFIALGLLLAALQAQGREAPPAVDDPVLEQRAMKLASELRCLVCQNQSLAESNAGLALDLKEQVRAQLRAGRSDEEIRTYMVERYGDFVLYNPPWKSTTLLLWLGPFLLLVAGGVVLAGALRKRRALAADLDLSEEQRARARALLGEDGDTR